MRRTAAAANRTGLIILGLIALLIGLAVLIAVSLLFLL